MKKTCISILLAAAFLLLPACGAVHTPPDAAETASPAAAADESAKQTEAPGTPAPAAEPGRQDGERFEAVIMIEGMEETVHYEHIVNKALGFEMDYDYEQFVRRSEADRERFFSVWDDPGDPENTLDLSYRPENVEAVAAELRASLSQTYDLYETTRELERAGSCIYIEASVLKGTNLMADRLQLVYLIPASDGCLVAEEHLAVEASEGFGRRYGYMLNTLAISG